MGDLVITDCPNFSAGALRRLVIARLQFAQRNVYRDPGILGVRISGLAPNISTEDQQQISQHVYEFKYDPSSS
jgi:ABC-type transport system involved in cytochrome c biogenesis ATPase subunit